MPFARPSLALMAAALLIAGCGSSDGSGYGDRGGDSTEQPPTATATTPSAPPGAAARACEGTEVDGAGQLRVTGIACEAGHDVAAAWTATPACTEPAGASRYACSVGDGYRCLGAETDAGVAVSCSRPGRSVAFLAAR